MTDQPEQPQPQPQPQPNVPPQVPPGNQPPQGQQAPEGGYQAPPGHQPPHPAGYVPGSRPMSPQDEKTWATLVHLAPFAAALVGIPFLGPLIVYLIVKDRGPFVRFHAAQALNFQIIVTIALWVFGLLSFVLIGLPFLIATAVAWVVFPIIGAVKANNGEWYRYPMTPEMVK
jgi:uncharacterized Tic20 family protein